MVVHERKKRYDERVKEGLPDVSDSRDRPPRVERGFGQYLLTLRLLNVKGREVLEIGRDGGNGW